MVRHLTLEPLAVALAARPSICSFELTLLSQTNCAYVSADKISQKNVPEATWFTADAKQRI